MSKTIDLHKYSNFFFVFQTYFENLKELTTFDHISPN